MKISVLESVHCGGECDDDCN